MKARILTTHLAAIASAGSLALRPYVFAAPSTAQVLPLRADSSLTELWEPAGLPVSNPTIPLWSAHPEDNPLAKVGSEGPLTSDADVCIIGTGTTGTSAAYHVAKSVAETPLQGDPLKIVLLEARDFCTSCIQTMSSSPESD